MLSLFLETTVTKLGLLNLEILGVLLNGRELGLIWMKITGLESTKLLEKRWVKVKLMMVSSLWT